MIEYMYETQTITRFLSQVKVVSLHPCCLAQQTRMPSHASQYHHGTREGSQAVQLTPGTLSP